MHQGSEHLRERQKAARVLRAFRDEVIRRWMQRIRLLASERGASLAVANRTFLEDAREFVDMIVSRLEGRNLEADVAAFYHLILEGREHNVRMADITYGLLEFKSIGKQIIFENVRDELEAFRVSRHVDDTFEALLRRTAELYELTAEADQQVTRDRLQEVFTAWDIEAALSDAQTRAEVCRLATRKLREIWDLAGCRFRFETPGPDGSREWGEGAGLPVPMFQEQRQYLTEEEVAAGGVVSLTESVRRRRHEFVLPYVHDDPRLINAGELEAAGVRSVACCALLSRDRVLGTVLLYGQEAGAFKMGDARKLRDIAGVLALALDRTDHLERSHREISEAEVIARIGRSLLELPTREELLQGVAEALRSFRDYFDVSLFRIERKAGECVLVAEAGRERRYRPEGYRQKIGEGFIGLCAETGRTIRASDLDADARRLIAFEEEYRARSELALPVKRGEEVIGVIHILSEREDDFPDSEVAALEHASPHIGVALMNARMLTERLRDRYEIEQAHRQLTTIIRSTAVGITSTDTRGVYTHWSPSCEQMLGYEADEVLGRHTPADFSAEPYDLRESLENCLRQGRTEAERAVLRKDGTARIIRETRVPMHDEHGEHVGFTSYLVDITDQKKAEQRMRRELDTLNLAVEAMGAGLALFDGELRMQWANSTMMQWFGFGPDLFGRSCHEARLCGADVEPCPAREALSSGVARSRIHELTDDAGVWHCYQHVFTPVAHGDTRLLLLTMDITEQRRQTEQMRLINTLTEKVETSLDLDRVLHLVLTCVTAGHAIGFNRAFLFLIDEGRQWLEGRMAVGPTSAEEAARIWAELAQREQTVEELLESAVPSESDGRLTELVRELRIPLSDREDTLVSTLMSRTSAHVGDARSDPHMHPELTRRLELGEFVCVPLVAQDEPLGVMLADNRYSRAPIGEDQVGLVEMFCRQASLAIANAHAYQRIHSQLIELQKTRDRLIEAERMASVGRMASHMAHEIRNPLTAIGGFASSIARQHRDDPKTARNATIIYEEARRLERTLANVLDYTRPLRPQKAPADLNEIVRQTVEQFRSYLEEENVSVRLSLAGQLPRILADAEMIKQVVINLLKNATEAMERKGGGILSISTAAREQAVELVVSDTGPGMEQDVLENLFSPFFSTKIGGIGLGLSVSQQIVRLHGGHIEVHTEPGVGSTFTVTLAVGEGVAESAQEAAPTRAQRQ